jgi:hypothetical protein
LRRQGCSGIFGHQATTMAQIFHRSTNTLSKVSIFGAVFFLASLGWLVSAFSRSAYSTGQGVVPPGSRQRPPA